MTQFEIADLVLNIDCDNINMLKKLSEFKLNQQRKADLNLVIKCLDYIDAPQGEVFSEQRIKWSKKNVDPGGYSIYYEVEEKKKVLTLVDIDTQWENATLSYINNENKPLHDDYGEQTEILTHLLAGAFFQYNVILHDGMVIHSSTLEWNGKGIMFSAPSGTGKSTQVRLWQERFGSQVKVLNDDTPVVRFRDDIPYVFGTPWAGSSGIYSKGCAPVAAIVLLQQAPTNSISQLSLQEALSGLMPRIFLPYFDKDMLDTVLNTFERVLSSVPVYELKCRPDQEAVELVYECLK